MREALARADHDFVLAADPKPRSKPKAKAAKSRKTRGGDDASWFAVMRANPGRTVSIVAFAGFLGAVAVNALVLQNGRTAAPPLPAAQQQSAQAQPSTANMPPLSTLATAPVPQGFVHAASAPASADSPAPAVPQPPRRAVAAPQPAETHQRDAIADLLNGGAPPAASVAQASTSVAGPKPAAPPNKNVIAAQRALTKLGFNVPATGMMGPATRQAVEKFEKSRGLPVKGDLTPKVMRDLASASGIAIN